MKTKLSLIILSFIILSSFVSAGSPYPDSNPFGAARIFHLDDNCDDGTNTEDCTVLGNPTFTTTLPSGFGGKSLLLDGTGDAVDSNYGQGDMSNTDAYSACFWWKQVGGDANLYYTGIVDTGGQDMFFYLFHRDTGDDLEFFLRSNTGVEKDDSREENGDTVTSNGDFHHICITKASGGGADKLKIYRNGTRVDDTTDASDTVDTIALDYDFYFGGRNTDGSLSGEMNTYIDDVVIFDNTEITAGQVNTMFLGNYTPDAENESSERTFVFEQVGSTSVNSANFVTIMNNTFNISNSSPMYFGYRTSVDSSTNSKMECRILVDGNSFQSEINKSTSSNIETMYVITNVTQDLSVGEHWSAFQCKRIGGGNINIELTYGVGHNLIDEQNQIINHNDIHREDIDINSSTFTSVFNISLVATNINLSSKIRSMIFNWAEEIHYHVEGEGVTLIKVNGTNCSIYPRFDTVDLSGNIGGDCVINNVGANENITFEVLFKGDAHIHHFHGVVKEFIHASGELVSANLTGLNVRNSVLTNILNVSFVNADHESFSFFTKAGIPIKSNVANTDASFQFRISGVEQQNGTIYPHLAQVNNTVSIIQYVFTNLSLGNYTLELWAQCDNSNCSINGGDLVGYITDSQPTIPVALEVRAFDAFDNSTILNFSVAVEGELTFSTTTGVVNVVHENQFANLTITSGFNGGYFPLFVLNHNGSEGNLNVSLNQTIINWDCSEKVSDNDLSCDSPLETVFFHYNVIGNPHSQNISVSGYFNNTEIFNVTALQNETLTSLFFSTNLSIRAVSFNVTPSVTTCSYNVSSLNFTTFSEVVSGSPNSSIGLINGTYSVLAMCENFAFSTLNVTIVNVTQNLTFTLFPTNSINFSFFNEANPEVLLSGRNITLDLIREGETINLSTTTGSIFVNGLVSTEWEARYNSEGFDARSFFFTVTPNSTQNINLYFSNSSKTEQWIIRTADASDVDILNATVRLQRQFISMEGQFVTVEECKTNSDGECDMFIEENSEVIYRFIVIISGTTVLTTVPSNVFVLPDQQRIKVLRVKAGAIGLSSFKSVISIFGDFVCDESFSNYSFSYIDSLNQISGACVDVDRRIIPNSTYTRLNTTCLSITSGDIFGNVSNFIINDSEVRITAFVNFTNQNVDIGSCSFLGNKTEVYAGGEGDELLLTAFFFGAIVLLTSQIPNMIIVTIINFVILLIMAIIGLNKIVISGVVLLLAFGIALNWRRKQTRGKGGVF